MSSSEALVEGPFQKCIEYGAAGLAYLAAAMVFYRSVLFGNAIFPVDFPDMDYPRFTFFTRWIHQLVFPMWDPHIGFGIPLAGQMGSQNFYPPIYLMYLLGGAKPGPRVVEWTLICHLALAALGAYTLCRVLRLSPPACFTAGLVFAFGGFFPLRMFHGGWVETASWFPFVLAAWLRFIETRRLRYLAWMSGVFLIMMLAGFWQQVMYSMYFVLFWAVWESAIRIARGDLRRIALLPIAGVLLASGAALVCDTAEISPTYQFATQTVRQKLTYEESAGTGLRPSDLPSILWAGMFSGKDGAALWNARRVNSGIRDYYSGTFTLVLLGYNLFLLIRRPERNQVFLWMALAFFAAASFGAITPAFWLLYHLAPGFSFFRRSGSLYYFAVLAAAVLCAYSLNDMLSRSPAVPVRLAGRVMLGLGTVAILYFLVVGGLASRGALLFGLVFAVLGSALLAIPRVPPRASLIVYTLGVFCFTDLYYFHSEQFLFVLRNFKYPDASGIAALGNTPGDPYRVALAPFGGNWDNFGEIAGFDNPGGYLIFRLKRYQDYIARIQSIDSPLLAEANVRYLLTRGDMMVTQTGAKRLALSPTENRVQLPAGPPSTPPYRLAWNGAGGLRMFQNDNATPRYYFSSSMEVVPDPKTQLDRISEPDFAIHRAAVLAVSPGVSIDNCAADPVNVLDTTPNTIRLRVVSHGNCLLVATDSYHPDWRMYLDGKRSPVYLANAVFRASVVSAGSHLVELKFEPEMFWMGLAVSGLAGFALTGLFWLFKGRVELYFRAVGE